MANYTDITIVLDRSGSMQSIREDMEGAITSFLKEHRAIPTTRVSLVQFDGTNPYDVVYEARPITDVPTFRLHPRGSTPLLDAMCQTIDRTGSRFAAMKQDDRPERVLMVIITDGQENASRYHTRNDIKARVEKQSNIYNWQFTYLGANQDAIAEAQTFGIAFDHAINYAATRGGTAGMIASLTSNTMDYARGRTKSISAYTVQQREQAADGDEKLAGSTTTTTTK